MITKIKYEKKHRNANVSMLKDWIKKAIPSEEEAFIFHDPKLKRKSKYAIAYGIANNYKISTGTGIKIKVETHTDDNLHYKNGYEPVVIWVVRRDERREKSSSI